MPDDDDDPFEALRRRLRGREAAAPTSRLRRALSMGRNAAGIATTALQRRVFGDDDAPFDLEAIAPIIERLGELKGVSMKAAQMIGTIEGPLPDELRRALATLQTAAAKAPFSVVERTIREALGERASALLATMQREPAAVASIGQVHRAVVDGRDVAVKVLHAEAEAALRADFDTARTGVGFVTTLMPGAAKAAKETLAEARTAMIEECDFSLEAQRQTKFAALFADDADIVVPAVLPAFSARTVLTTNWTPGRSLDALLSANPPQAARDLAGAALFRFYVGTLYRHGLFHADPHPGNYAFPNDGRVVVYDFGCVRTFYRPTVASYARLVAAVRDDDVHRVRAALVELGGVVPDQDRDLAAVRRLFRGLFGPLTQAGPRAIDATVGGTMREVARDKQLLARVALPGKLVFLFRLRFGLYSVLARMGAVADWAALESGWAEEALAVED